MGTSGLCHKVLVFYQCYNNQNGIAIVSNVILAKEQVKQMVRKIWPNKFFKIEDFYNQYFYYKSKSKWGIVLSSI